jgi:alcohol dehydrogenase/L-iditol 2-dehydrogenase
MTASTMPAVVQYGLDAHQTELREVPVPRVADGEVLLRVGAASVCGSDVHQYLATRSWRVEVPVTLGHEFTGTVAAAGSGVDGFREGDRVVSETAARICGRCVYCRSGQYNVCPHRQGFGTMVDGAMAGYVAVPARCLHHIPDTLPFETAALTEPTCVAYNAVVERSLVKPGDIVLVLGPGPIGLLCLSVARLRGAGTLIMAGLSADAARLELARTLGATHTVDLERDDLSAVLAGIGDGYGADLVIDAAGVSASFRTAMASVRPMGQITKVGWGPAPLNASLDPIVGKAVTVNGSFSHTYRTWERVIEILAAGQINVRALVGLETPLENWRAGFDGMHAGAITKAVLLP